MGKSIISGEDNKILNNTFYGLGSMRGFTNQGSVIENNNFYGSYTGISPFKFHSESVDWNNSNWAARIDNGGACTVKNNNFIDFGYKGIWMHGQDVIIENNNFNIHSPEV